MKLSDYTLTVLKNFSTINSGLVLQPGTKQRTMSPEKTILVEVDLEDFETDDLVDELKRRVRRGEDFYLDEISPDYGKAIDYFKRGNIEEAMIYLERAFPDFRGLSKYIKD